VERAVARFIKLIQAMRRMEKAIMEAMITTLILPCPGTSFENSE
jgi:hypothetical protein